MKLKNIFETLQNWMYERNWLIDLDKDKTKYLYEILYNGRQL